MKDLKPDAKTLAEDRAEHRTIATRFNAVVPDNIVEPLDLGPLWLETLGLMVLGMAGFKSGFLTGQWDDRKYRKAALAGLGIGLAAYGIFAVIIWRTNFAPIEFFGIGQVYSPLFRPVMAMGYAALFILMFRSPGAWRDRFAAVGRTAFSITSAVRSSALCCSTALAAASMRRYRAARRGCWFRRCGR